MNKNVKITQFTISWVIFRFPTTEKRNAKIKKSYIFCFTINDTLYTTNVPWASPRGSLREGHARDKILPYLMQTPPNEPMTVNVETPCLRGALRLQNPYFDTNIPIHIIHPLDLKKLDSLSEYLSNLEGVPPTRGFWTRDCKCLDPTWTYCVFCASSDILV